MRRYVFEWRGEYFCLDTAALAFWPEARLVVPPDNTERPRLVTTDAYFADFARSLGAEINQEMSAADQCVLARDALNDRGYKSGNIGQVIALIRDHPDSQLAQRSVEALLHWCIIERDIRRPPDNERVSTDDEDLP